MQEKPRVLVIDDDAQLRTLYARALRNHFTVDVESNGPTALRRLHRGDWFDVILCDRGLDAAMSGDELYDALETAMQRRFVMCCGVEAAEGDALAALLGDRFVWKLQPMPLLISRLLAVVASETPRTPRATRIPSAA